MVPRVTLYPSHLPLLIQMNFDHQVMEHGRQDSQPDQPNLFSNFFQLPTDHRNKFLIYILDLLDLKYKDPVCWLLDLFVLLDCFRSDQQYRQDDKDRNRYRN